MGFLDQISKTITTGVDRAKFEAEKFQKTTRLQGEANEFRRQIDAKLGEIGQRAYELQRAGQINSATIAELATAIDQLRGALVVKEEELKRAQAEIYEEPPPAPGGPPPAQHVPITVEQAAPPPAPAPAASKACAVCGFQMPGTAMFCPNCGTRVA